MRGEVLYFDAERGIGFINGDDGNRYHFASADLATPSRPVKGVAVEFTTEGNRAHEVIVTGGAGAPAAPAHVAAPIDGEIAADAPQPGRRSLFGHFLACVTSNYLRFSGRAPRREYWGFALFMFLFLVVAIFGGLIVDAMVGNLDSDEPVLTIGLTSVLLLALILPSLSVTIRRLHDIGLSGWFILLGFIPTVGNLIILVFCLIPSQKNDNRWGPVPS